MSEDAEKLEEGWYWVRWDNDSEWEPAKIYWSGRGKCWRASMRGGDAGARFLAEIGPRITPPTDGEK